MGDWQTIGAFARAAGVSPSAVRFYERAGLIAPRQRSAAGYRLYDEVAARRLTFILRAKDLGFSLAEIRELLGLRVAGGRSCGEVKRQAEKKIARVDRQLAELARMRRALRDLAGQCGAGRHPEGECPILDALEHKPLTGPGY